MPRYSLKSLLLVTTLIGVEAGLLILVVRQRSLASIEPNLSLFIFVAFGAVVGAVLLARFHRPAFGAAIGRDCANCHFVHQGVCFSKPLARHSRFMATTTMEISRFSGPCQSAAGAIP